MQYEFSVLADQFDAYEYGFDSIHTYHFYAFMSQGRLGVIFIYEYVFLSFRAVPFVLDFNTGPISVQRSPEGGAAAASTSGQPAFPPNTLGGNAGCIEPLPDNSFQITMQGVEYGSSVIHAYIDAPLRATTGIVPTLSFLSFGSICT